MARSRSEAAAVSQANRSANGGSGQLERETARRLRNRTGVLTPLMDARSISAGDACDAYQVGQLGAAVVDGPEVQALLSRMRWESQYGEASREAIDLACEIRGAPDGI